MTALLERPEIRQLVRSISVGEYQRLAEGEATELLRGLVIGKQLRSPLHSSIADEIWDQLEAQVSRPLLVLHERPLTLADSEPEPDVCIVRGGKADFRDRHSSTAELVVEVAITSLEIDRIKAAHLCGSWRS